MSVQGKNETGVLRMNTQISCVNNKGILDVFEINGIPSMEYLAEFVAKLSKMGFSQIKVLILGY